jgi:DNA repair exonuclease SbcCD ATPase subunit
MRKEYSDYEEDEALIQLSEEELGKFIRVAEAYLKYPNNTEVELAFTSNVASLLENIKKIRYSYYDNLPELLGKVLGILEKIQSQTKDDNIKALVEEAIDEVKNFYGRFNLPYEKYYYSYKYPYYTYPYSKEDKVRRAKEIYKEELGKLVDMAKQQEDENIRTMIKDNLLGDLVIQSSSYGDKLPTIIDEFQRRQDWLDLDARLLKIVQEIQNEKQELEKAKEELAKLQNKEVELSADEEKVKELQKKLIERAIDYVIYAGKEQ